MIHYAICSIEYKVDELITNWILPKLLDLLTVW